ncbi:MAG: glycosyltransferase, partial [Chloroflexi bacterium]|nr:glycosyltransferase [Chloroflexota bacterium]
VADGELLIGLVGRLDPMKGHPTFLRAAAAIALACPQARFVCVGDGPAAYRARLRALCLSLGLDGKIEWAGHQNDMASVYSAMDVAVSVSLSEGFSNAIGEAMACAVPCIVTPAGDSALIVGPTGSVVPPNDPVAMSQACRHFIELSERERRQLGLQARARIEQEFNVPRLIERTQNAFTSLGFD